MPRSKRGSKQVTASKNETIPFDSAPASEATANAKEPIEVSPTSQKQWISMSPDDLTAGFGKLISDNSPYVAGAHRKRIFDLSFRPDDSSILASASDDDTAVVWGLEGPRWRQRLVLRGHSDCVLRVAWAPGGAAIATGSADGTVALWNCAGSEANGGVSLCPSARLTGHPEEVYACEFLRSCWGSRLASASGDSVFLWDPERPALLQRSSTRDEGIEALRLEDGPPDPGLGYVFGLRESPAGGLLAAACSDGHVCTWGLSAGGTIEPASRMRLHSGMACGIAISPDGRQLVSTSHNGELVVVDQRMWRVTMRFLSDCVLMSPVFVPGQQGASALICAGSDGRLWSFSLAEGGTLQGNSRALSQLGAEQLAAAASADAKRVACAGELAQLPRGEESAAALDAHLGVDAVSWDQSQPVLMSNNPVHQAQLSLRAVISVWDL
mmetsp:Transcript_17419/g.41656  ORF Transcript_17419/g.41656 Transcript_17419/m.41656 type:complete len:440 (-) Transcript_17419:85-1404(-)